MPATPPTRRLHLTPHEAAGNADTPRSAAQQQFDTLTARIAEQRALLSAWHSAIDTYDQRVLRDYLPVHAEYRQHYFELLEHLENAALGGMRLSRHEVQSLHELIAEMAASLLLDESDPARRQHLAAVHERYAPAVPGADSDSGEDADTEAMLQHMEDALDAAKAKADAARERRRAERKKKGTTREQQAQQKTEEAVQASQSIRAVYRQLVSALHPDREPDEQERQRKTALMQRVNEAYAANRLHDLLQLQLEIAQIDAQHLSNLNEARLDSYNHMLSEQLAQLKQELRNLESDFKARHGLNPHGKLSPDMLADRLRHEITRLNTSIRELQRERRALDEPSFFKRWLKAQRP